MGLIEGKVALITGGSRGQGRAHAITCAREGADVVIVDLTKPVVDVPYKLATPDRLTLHGPAADDARPLLAEGDLVRQAGVILEHRDGSGRLPAASMSASAAAGAEPMTSSVAGDTTANRAAVEGVFHCPPMKKFRRSKSRPAIVVDGKLELEFM